MSIEEKNGWRKVNFMAEIDTVDFVKQQLGVESLSLTLRKLLLVFGNDKELQARVCALNVDTQSAYEKLQSNKK